MIVPKPQHLARRDGSFAFTSHTSLTADESAGSAAAALRRAIGPATGFALASPDDGNLADVALMVDADEVRPEGYALTVTPQRLEVVGGDPAGVFYGVQSLRQLLPIEAFSPTPVERRWMVPAMTIEDRPQFAWRGVMLDVARHFMSKGFVLELLDLLALHKLNVLHLHLTDDQGWRLVSEKYPNLTEVGAWRSETLIGHAGMPASEWSFDGTPHGGFYSRDDIREIVAFAAARFITVVPEIDMPGHMLAAIAAYPELGHGFRPASVGTVWGISEQVLNVEDTTLAFCRDVLAEVMDVFPSPFIHCGGDECPTSEWKASEVAQQRIRTLGLADENELQAWFTGHMAAYLAANGRRFVGWDEVLEGDGAANLPRNAVVMSWRREAGGIEAARAGLDVVMTPMSHTYLDFYQGPFGSEPLAIGGLTTLETVYDYRPVAPELDPEAARHVLGSQAQLWTEYVPDPAHAEYMLFPRLCAFAEAVWRDDSAGIEAYEAFLDRLRPHLARLDLLGVNHRSLDD